MEVRGRGGEGTGGVAVVGEVRGGAGVEGVRDAGEVLVPFRTGGCGDGVTGEEVGRGGSVGPGRNTEKSETTGIPHRYHGNDKQQQTARRTATAYKVALLKTFFRSKPLACMLT